MTATPPTRDTTRIRLLSYNFYLRPPGINGNGNDYKDQRLECFIRHELDKFDIICFQECFAALSSRRDHLLKMAKDRGFLYHHVSPRRCILGLRIDGGLVIISRFPILATALTTYPRGKDSDWLCAKGALYAKLSVNGTPFHLFTTHTQASYKAKPELSDPNAQIRLKQVHLMQEFINQTLKKMDYSSKEPVVVCGDFNTDARLACSKDAKTVKIPGHSEEYLAILDILRGKGIPQEKVEKKKKRHNKRNTSPFAYGEGKECWKITDLLLEANDQFHPITFADIKVDDQGVPEKDEKDDWIPNEVQLTSHDELCGMYRLDYIFVFTPLYFDHSVEPAFDVIETKVEQMFVDDIPVIQLSDHYGVSTILEFIASS